MFLTVVCSYLNCAIDSCLRVTILPFYGAKT